MAEVEELLAVSMAVKGAAGTAVLAPRVQLTDLCSVFEVIDRG